MPSRKPNIAVLAGYWSTNIGNAFFQIGAQWLLQQALPDANVFLIGDQPGYWNVGRGNPANAIDYVKHLDLDAVVIQGPFCRPEMESLTGDLIRTQHRKGARIIILAAGMMQYDDATVQLSRRLLEEAPPYLMTTRDTETYELLGDLAEHAYDGIDVATFVSDIFPAIPTDLDPYVVLNFDQIPEPRFEVARDGQTNTFEWDGETWRFEQPTLATEAAYKSRAFLFARAAMPRLGTPPGSIRGYDLIRTDHRYNPFMPRKSYAAPRSYASDVPWTYLNIYAHSTCTFSNRVHACVATASYGNPAMLFTRSPRAYLLKRLGLDTIKERPTTIDPVFLRDEKARMIGWVTDRMRSFDEALV